jgi:SAM-dependent methyltransferase
MALSRGSIKSYPQNFQTSFTINVPKKVAYQNRKILKIVRKRLDSQIHDPPLEEIDSTKNKRFSFLYWLHKHLIKSIGNSSSQKIKRVIFNLIEDRPKTILDASCGESSLINELYNKYKPEICIGNDISWKTITLIKNKNPAILFTNHNVLNLPYKIKFDLVIFKNTLHHIKKENQKEVLNNFKRIAKQLIVVDIEDPQHSTLRSKLWNDYYVYLLGDQGDSFLNFDEFKRLINSIQRGVSNKTKIGIINTIKGKYFYASIKS